MDYYKKYLKYKSKYLELKQKGGFGPKCKNDEIKKKIGFMRHECEKCGENKIKRGNECVDCGENQIKQGNECVECGENQIKRGNECVDCGENQIKQGNECVECGSNSIKDGNKCVECKDSEYYNTEKQICEDKLNFKNTGIRIGNAINKKNISDENDKNEVKEYIKNNKCKDNNELIYNKFKEKYECMDETSKNKYLTNFCKKPEEPVFNNVINDYFCDDPANANFYKLF
jgi:hypothetical protein